MENDNTLKSLYLFYGPEKYLIEEDLKKIKKSFGKIQSGINYIEIDDCNVLEIISNLETPAFGFDKKLILVKNSGLFKKDTKGQIGESREKLEKYLKDNFEFVKDFNVLIFLEEDALKTLNIYKFIQKEGIIIEHDFLKPFQIKDRIKKISNAYKVSIDDSTAEYFIDTVGTNMQDVMNELRKQIEFAGAGESIKKENIDKLSIKQMQAIIFDLTDNLGQKNISKSMEILETLVYNKEPYQKIIITLYNHFKKLYLLKLYERENVSCDISEALSLKANQTFLVSKYRRQAGYFSENELRQLLLELTDLDYKSKNGLIDIEVGIKSILCKNS